jgi:hypothetical protein
MEIASHAGPNVSVVSANCKFSIIASPENAPLGANIVQGVDILWD